MVHSGANDLTNGIDTTIQIWKFVAVLEETNHSDIKKSEEISTIHNRLKIQLKVCSSLIIRTLMVLASVEANHNLIWKAQRS